MAQSPAHRLGQIVGTELEAAIHTPLLAIANEFGLYLDYKHPRPARKRKKKVSWKDSLGNTHDLDYVLEEGGTEESQGYPRAFIEIAWRRYTKHSRNKAQEIQGALSPLAKAYQNPFLGAVLAGVFTEGSLNQFRSNNFNIVHLPYETIIRAFANERVDISSEEGTGEAELQRKVNTYERLSSVRKKRISDGIRNLNTELLDGFFTKLRLAISRCIEQVFVLTLSGDSHRFDSVEGAIQFISKYDQSTPATGFVCYEMNIRYSNGDELRGRYHEKENAIQFLQSLDS